jgi:hypothetical protein
MATLLTILRGNLRRKQYQLDMCEHAPCTAEMESRTLYAREILSEMSAIQTAMALELDRMLNAEPELNDSPF